MIIDQGILLNNTIFILVPNTLEGQLTISNLEYLREYANTNSPIYKSITTELTNAIKEALSSSNKRDGEINVKIMSLK